MTAYIELRSKSVQDAILTEVKPHIVAMRSARNKLQKSYDAAKADQGFKSNFEDLL